MTLSVRPTPQERLRRAPAARPLMPRFQSSWLEDLVKAASDQAISTDGQRAAGLVHDLAQQRMELQDSMEQAITQMMSLVSEARPEGIQGLAAEIREVTKGQQQILANLKMLAQNQHRLLDEVRNLSAVVHQRKAPPERSE